MDEGTAIFDNVIVAQDAVAAATLAYAVTVHAVPPLAAEVVVVLVVVVAFVDVEVVLVVVVDVLAVVVEVLALVVVVEVFLVLVLLVTAPVEGTHYRDLA